MCPIIYKQIFHNYAVSRDRAMNTAFTITSRIAALSFFLLNICSALPIQARDIDVYSINAKQNAYVLVDSSVSMGFGVYEHVINYGEMYDYFVGLNPHGDNKYIYDTIINGDTYEFTTPAGSYLPASEAQRIYLWKSESDIGVYYTCIPDDTGCTPTAFTGDPSDPDFIWDPSYLIDTYTLLDENGNLIPDGSGQTPRLTTDENGYVLFDGEPLPNGQDVKVNDRLGLYNKAVVDSGFAGLLQAPGYYFSGYHTLDRELIDGISLIEPESNLPPYFFVTGNWVNMQAVYNLRYITSKPIPDKAREGDRACFFEPFPIPENSWFKLEWNLDYPELSSTYDKNLKETDTAETIEQAGALKIRVRFASFDVEGDGDSTTFRDDYIAIYDAYGNQVIQYDNDNSPLTDGGWSPEINGDTVTIKLKSNALVAGSGYVIDKIAYIDDEAYTVQSRLEIAKNAMMDVVDAFRGKMNWGFASFAGANQGGANVAPTLNPTDNDDAQRASIVKQIELVKADNQGSPIMEALQDVWAKGYYGRRTSLENLLCRKNFVVSVTDGFPSADDDNQRISGVQFDDWDGDNWSQDPSQGLAHLPDYYDDVAHWMYTHSWMDMSPVDDPANSFENVTTHHVAFGARHPLLEDAAEDSGGEYLEAYNDAQLSAAFYSLAMIMSEAVSFTAPVVSVDAVNKIQSGEDLYMGLFLPQDSNYWAGNVKKFKIGDGSSADRELFMIYDRLGREAINSEGNFLDNTAGFWGDDNDINDIDQYGAADIKEDGSGEVLLEDVQDFFANGNYYSRAIYTAKEVSGQWQMVKFDRTNITNTDLQVDDILARDMLVNFTHGYTYDANASGDPVAVRDWVLGAIIHSQPVVVDYYDTTQSNLPLVRRFLVVGSNDGMLHVFDDSDGREILAFIPPDLLGKLKDVQANYYYDMVDGPVTLYRRDKNPKYLILGERRGGGYYWALDVQDSDPANWTVAWDFTDTEMLQSWSEVKFASLPVNIDSATGKRVYKDVAIFTGGYDPEEDNFPEPFDDEDSDGTPYDANGVIDTKQWSKSDADQDLNNDDIYNSYNPGSNDYGRAIYIVDVDDPAAETIVTLSADILPTTILPFSARYGANENSTGNLQTYPGMNYSIPSSPGVVTGMDVNYYSTGSGIARSYQSNVFFAMYAPDIYANLYKVDYSMEVVNLGSDSSPNWRVELAEWKTRKIFNANPGSTSARAGDLNPADDFSDQGRKTFYPPAISWGGSKGYFETGNFYFPDVSFDTKNKMASVFFGTGDREHPKYTMIRNRFYAIYDDSSMTARNTNTNQEVTITSAPYFEKDLLNLTCDELGLDSQITSCYLGDLDGMCDASSADTDMKRYLKTLLRDNAVYPVTEGLELEQGATYENDKKGWYIVLNDQASSVCGHMKYATLINDLTLNDHDNHYGEQVLSKPSLYYGTLYFTSYQAGGEDTCRPIDHGYSYAINYLDATATYNLNYQSSNKKDITDRYKKFTDISGIPSGYTIITHKGKAAAMASMGASVAGPSPDPTPFQIQTPGTGLELYYWRDTNSQANP